MTGVHAESAPGEIAVVIPVHNGINFTERCLEQITQACEREAIILTIIVIDDGSTDGTAERLRRAWPDVHVVAGDGNLWWSGACDVGARYAIARGAKYILLLNNDNIVVSDPFFSRLRDVVAERDGCAAAIALTDTPQRGGRVLQAGGRLNWRGRGISLRDEGAKPTLERATIACDWLPGCALMFRAELFLELGGIDARRFPQYRGDIDFTVRARAAGYVCNAVADCWVVNDKRQTGMHFSRRVGVSAAIRGLVSLRSNYNVRETVTFAWRHAPRRAIARYLTLFYARYFYACLKSWNRRASGDQSAMPTT